MDDNEQIEILGLAATIGRLMASIKQLEEQLAQAQTKIQELETQKEK